MSVTLSRPLQLTAEQIRQALSIQTGEIFPELQGARQTLQALREAPQAQWLLAQTQPFMENIQHIPQTPYTFYRFFQRNGDRKNYEGPYFQKRANVAAAVLRLFLGQSDLKDVAQDYLWNICEETNWVAPAHERYPIDLFAAETGFLLAETLYVLGETLDGEVRHRVRTEIERRIFDPYLRLHHSMWWYTGYNNWNGVCNSSVAATFLYLEPEPQRLARALEIAFAGLQVFLDTAFEEDGSSTEGVSYWHYGLINFVALAELLDARSSEAIRLLDSEQVRRIAAYPAKLQLSGSRFASFSDCDETSHFHPGMITRLAQRTRERSLLNLIARPATLEMDWRLTMMLRDLLWWDGRQPEAAHIDDAVLTSVGAARLVSQTSAGEPVILAIKAGHNQENHNQNDIGSFLLHVTGENLLTDPGRGLYSRDYFGPHRYENIFANSYGHSVPRIDGQLQGSGRSFEGQLVASDLTGQHPEKQVEIEFARAYPVPALTSARRQLRLATSGDASGTAWLHDHFTFVDAAHEIEETFITWYDCDIAGTSATIHGQQHDLLLTIEEPQDTRFALERLEEQSKANAKTEVLKRISVTLPPAKETTFNMRLEVRAIS